MRLRVLARHAAAFAAIAALAVGVTARAAGTLTVCTDAAPEGFDIVQYELAITNDSAGIPLYDQLLSFKPGSTELLPGLAESWDISADGLSYTFHLRKGVKFHSTPWFKPTRELNADDVLWSINRVNDKSHPAHGSAKSGYVYWAGMGMAELIKSVAKLDERTVRFTLTRPEAPFLANMAMAAIGSVYSAEYGEQLTRAGKLEQLNTQPIGSGPFVFRSYQKDAVIRYAANTAYWGGAPKIDNLVFAITLDADVRTQRLKAGECLVGIGLKPQAVASFANDAKVAIVRSNPLATVYLATNTKHKFIDDKRMREALWSAIDKKTYIDVVRAGQAVPAASFLPPGLWSHDATLADRHDPERARQLARAAGYDGSELLMFAALGGNGVRAGELLQADWARAGIKVKVQMLELGEMFKRGAKGDHDIMLLSWYGDNGDPDNFLTPNLSCDAEQAGGNKAHWCDKAFDALIDEARRITDMPRRTALYRQAQRRVYDEVAVIPMVYQVSMVAVNKRVKGYLASPFDNHDFRAVSID